MPTLTLSCCTSRDGYLDAEGPARAVLSDLEDLEAVLDLRARMDMIVVGAETVRRDDPSLATRGERHFRRRAREGRAPDPVKVVLSRSGRLPHERQIWSSGSAQAVVLSENESDAPATTIRVTEGPVDAVLGLAGAMGCEAVLVEGGAQILRHFLPRARWFRLAVADRVLGERGRAHLFDPDDFLAAHRPVYSQAFGTTTAHHIDLHRARARQLMDRAFDLAAACPPSAAAFAVGAIACDADMRVLATGYSRETGPHMHAEEVMLARLARAPHTVVCTLEPCLHRASKPTGCAERLVAAGVRRLYYAEAEDHTFTAQGGLAHLASHGVELIRLDGFESRFRAANQPVYGAA